MQQSFDDQLKSLGIDLNILIQNAVNKTEELLKGNFVIEAEIVVKQLLRVDPENLQGLQLYGLILHRKRQYKEAIETIGKAISIDDSNAENHNNIALCYLHSGNSEKALSHIALAKRLNPNNHNFMNNAGLILRSMGQLETSIRNFKQAIEMDPTDSKSWENLGSVYGQKKMLDDATNCFKKALELDPNNLGAHVDLAYAYHLKGEWEKAWEEYEYRLEYWHSVGRNPGRFYDVYKPDKNWDGVTGINGRKIIIYCEQGVGDMIQFVRFVPILKNLGAEVIIDAPPELKSLFEDFGTIRTSYKEELEYDCHCSILSLPYLLKLKHTQFLKDKPYIHACMHPAMADYDEYFKIGIVWAGNPGHPNDANRSVYLQNFRDIGNLPGVKLFSFQKELGKRVYANSDVQIDFAENCEDMKLVDLSQSMKDFKETSELLVGMDLVITVDTSVLHLAGAMGKKTFALIPYNPDWRWGIEGSDNAWYSSVELFRQKELGDWSETFEKLKVEVNDLLQNQR